MSAATARPPAPAAASVTVPAPPGACDTHLHVFGGRAEFPPSPGCTEYPAPGTLADWVRRLDGHLAALGIARAVLVHSVLYGEDNEVTARALAMLGQTRARGVALVRPGIGARDLAALHDAGFRGVRLNLSFPGALDLPGLREIAPRLADRGWHALVNLPRYVGLDLADMIEQLTTLPIPIVLDHYGYPDLACGVDPAILRRMEAGRLWVKLSAAYRQCSPPYRSLDGIVRDLVQVRPDRLLWASDWPHVRWNGAMPDDAVQLNALARQVPDAETRRAILVRNPAALYDFDTA